MIQSYFIFPGLPQSMPLDELIIKAVCGAYDTTYEQINCKCRRRELCECRQVIMALLYMSGKFSLVKVGLKFKRDHATVSHAVKTVKNLWDSSFDFRAKVIPILKKLNLPDNHFEKVYVNYPPTPKAMNGFYAPFIKKIAPKTTS